MFVHLSLHSNFSLLSGASPVEDMVRAAVERGYGAMALTDVNGLYAAVPFQSACNAMGVKPIFGADVRRKDSRAIILAKNRSGYGELCRLITSRHLDDQFDMIASTAALSDDVIILSHDEKTLEGLAGRKNVYVELNRFSDDIEGKQEVRRRMRLAGRLNLPPAATNDVHFIDPDGYRIHRILSAVRLNATVGMLPEGDIAHRQAWLKTRAAMEKLFEEVPESLKNVQRIQESCNVDLELGKRKPPRFSLPAGETAFSYLCQLCFEGLRERYRPIPKAAFDALNRELDVINRMDLAEYFLICWDIVRFAREKKMPCLGRGSAANSIVSYCLYITHVDPLKHNLFFERFLNAERTSLPDFDIDFGTDDREEVFRYVFDKFGEDHVAMICTYSAFRARSAVREIAKALGIPETEVGDFAKRLPFYAFPDEHIEARIQERPESRDLNIKKEPFRSILNLAKKISGFPRHLAVHPCGIVISPNPITDYMPLQRGEKGLVITQWSMYPVEDAGLIKIDLLGQKGLAVLTDTIRAVRKGGVHVPDPARIDYVNDRKTKEWMKEGKTEGCFYIESPVMIQLIRQARCDDFEVLTALSSIIRPGVSNYGGKNQYLRRLLNLEKTTFLHPALQPILKDTYGCMIYQEQVIQVAARIAGMSLAEADGLRRCMSKKRNWEKMDKYKKSFIQGGLQKGIPRKILDEIYRQIESFAGYAFCKAHSASFAVESFESMYWKCHYPAEFMAAVLTNKGGYYSQEEYTEEARRLGLKILPPCVGKSEKAFTGHKNSLRIGLMQIRNLQDKTVKRIINERKKRPFQSELDFFQRILPQKDEAVALAMSGALKIFGKTRPELMWVIEILYGKNKGNPEPLLMKEIQLDVIKKIPELPDYDWKKKMLLEAEYLGLFVSRHPLRLFSEKIEAIKKKRPVTQAVDLGEYNGRSVYCLGWKVTGKQTRTKEKKELMQFTVFSDQSGRFEVTLFPKKYRELAWELHKGKGPFLIKGKVEVQFGCPNLIAENLKLM